MKTLVFALMIETMTPDGFVEDIEEYGVILTPAFILLEE